MSSTIKLTPIRSEDLEVGDTVLIGDISTATMWKTDDKTGEVILIPDNQKWLRLRVPQNSEMLKMVKGTHENEVVGG